MPWAALMRDKRARWTESLKEPRRYSSPRRMRAKALRARPPSPSSMRIFSRAGPQLKSAGRAEPDTVALKQRGVPEADSHAAVRCLIVPRPAAKGSSRTRTSTTWIGPADVLSTVQIPTPLPYIPRNVMQTIPVGGKTPHRRSVG